MIGNYIKLAFRNLYKQKLYAGINILGLAVGFAFSILMLLWVLNELKVDRFHPDGKRIYRAYFYGGMAKTGGITYTQGASPFPLYTTLKELEGVENAAIYGLQNDRIFEVGDQVYYEEGGLGSVSMFEIFDFPLIAGSLRDAEAKPTTMLISRKIAEKYFGKYWEKEAVGSTITLDGQYELEVAAVFEDIPDISSKRFDYAVNFEIVKTLFGAEWAEDWGNKGFEVFAKLDPLVQPKNIEAQIDEIYKNAPGYGIGGEAMMLFPFEKNYLWTEFEKGLPSGGRIEYIRIFIGAALFLLLIAGINFINLSTARSSRRAKEVGVRKTVGAGKRSLVFQFMIETGIMVAIAITLGMFLASMLIPVMGGITDQELVFPFQSGKFLLALFGFWAFLSLCSGLYPAFILSDFQPVKVFKNDFQSRFNHARLRKGMVIFQFMLSSFLIIATLIVQKQLSFIQKENLGIDRENIVEYPCPTLYRRNMKYWQVN